VVYGEEKGAWVGDRYIHPPMRKEENWFRFLLVSNPNLLFNNFIGRALKRGKGVFGGEH